jgi:outer membrane receptor for monomeric catechols
VHFNRFLISSFQGSPRQLSEEAKIFDRSLVLHLLRGAIVFACLFATGHSASAQISSSGSSSESLNEITVQGVAPDHNVLPTGTGFSDVFGFDLPINEVPRSISVITKEELRNANVVTARDFARVSADTYTPYFNGNPSSTYIRGQVADTFFNGMRLGFTSEGVGAPIDFNAVERVNIVKGPAPAVYGASQNVGGFIDLITKQPYFDRFHAEVDATFGEYDLNRYTVELGGPIIPGKLAVRVSYSGEESGSYYRNVFTQSQAIYTVLKWTPNPNYELEILNSFYETNYQLNRGINRPTQALIDNGAYITGTEQFVNPTGKPIGPNFPASNLVPTMIPQNRGVVVATGTTQIDRANVIVNPNDSSYAKTDFAQVIQRLNISDDIQILNTTFFAYLSRRQFGALRYSAVVEPSYVLENRLELHVNSDIPMTKQPAKIEDTALSKEGKIADAVMSGQTTGWTIGNMLNIGLDFRYQHVFSASDIAHSYNNLYDLTQNPSLIDVPLNRVVSGKNPSYAIPGASGYFGTPGGTYVSRSGTIINTGNGETNDTWAYDGAIFLEDRVSFTKQLALFFGIRGDLLHVDFVDPVHPPGFNPVTANTTQGLINLNGNLTYQPFPWLTAYFTYDYSTSTTDGQGGGYSIGGDNKFDNPDFRNASDLYEGGCKVNLLDGKLYLAMAGFRQTRSIPQENAPTLPEIVWGGEVELNYQPNRNFYVTLSYSYLDPVLHNQSPSEKTLSVFNTFLPLVGNGSGSPNSTTLPQADYLQPGIPHHLFNANINYQFDFGLGLSFGAEVTSPIDVTYGGKIKIPTQFTLNAGASYRWKNYEVRVDFLNFTNEKNWAIVSATNGSDLIYPEMPFQVQGTLRIRF